MFATSRTNNKWSFRELISKSSPSKCVRTVRARAPKCLHAGDCRLSTNALASSSTGAFILPIASMKSFVGILKDTTPECELSVGEAAATGVGTS